MNYRDLSITESLDLYCHTTEYYLLDFCSINDGVLAYKGIEDGWKVGEHKQLIENFHL
jgi:hypothetical protein